MKNKNDSKKVLVAMSGGVDSSTVAYLLKCEGYEVIGAFMRLYKGYEEAENYARSVANKLKIRFYPVNISRDFKDKVFSYFISSYAKGLTPNPCVECNKLIKFGKLREVAKDLGCDYMATGHYVKKSKVNPGYSGQKSKVIYKLFKSNDINKDQTYFLYNLNQNILKHVLFPLGEYKKEVIREIADKAKLPYNKKESQDICFLNQNGKIIDHNEILKKNLKLKPGKIKTAEGKIIGDHQGLPLYTVGQRRGVEIGGTGPYYVIRADYETDTLYVSKNGEDPGLYKASLTAKKLNWISGHEPEFPYACEAVIRYKHKPVKCRLFKSGQNVKVKLNEPQRAVTPGQSVVFYKGEELTGGGVIIK